MKPFLVLFAAFLWSQVPAWAQQSCECDRLLDQKRRGFDYRSGEADSVVTVFSRHFHKLDIQTLPYACPDLPVSAIICDKNRIKYIFYDQNFFTKLTGAARQGDRFLLAHEVAHHVLGHTTKAFHLRDSTARVATNTPFRSTTLTSIGRDKREQTHIIDIPASHLEELQADALGLWIVLRHGMGRNYLDQLFGVLPILFKKNSNQAGTHPSLKMRQKMLERQFPQLQKSTYLLKTKALGSAQPIPFDTNDQWASYDTARVTEIFEQDTRANYAFELISAREGEVQELTEYEQSKRREIDRKLRFMAEPVVAVQYLIPSLSVDNVLVEASPMGGVVVGGRLGWGAWNRRYRVEADLLGGQQTLTTLAQLADGWRAIEEFKTTYLHVRPRFVWNWSIHAAHAAYRSHLWMLTAGPTAHVPLARNYRNYVAPAYGYPGKRVGWGGVAGVGYGWSNWRAGHYRLWLLYQCQSMPFSTFAPGTVRAAMHTISLEASARLWK